MLSAFKRQIVLMCRTLGDKLKSSLTARYLQISRSCRTLVNKWRLLSADKISASWWPDKFWPDLTPVKNPLFYDEKSARVRRPQTKRNGTLRSGTYTFKITTTTTKLAGLRGLTNWYIAKCLFARHCIAFPLETRKILHFWLFLPRTTFVFAESRTRETEVEIQSNTYQICLSFYSFDAGMHVRARQNGISPRQSNSGWRLSFHHEVNKSACHAPVTNSWPLHH